MSEANKAVVRKVYEIITTGNFDRVEEIIDPDAADNERPPQMGQPRAKLLEIFEQFATEAHTAFPDMSIPVEDMIAEGDRVAARLTMRGSHRGQFMSIAPTGKRVKISAIDIFRFVDGRVVEHWGHSDDPTGILRSPDQP